MKNKKSKNWLREPLIHFFVLGLAIFGLHAALDRKPEAVADDPYLIEVSSADIEWFRTMWSKRMGREPTVQDLRGQVNQLIREQILSREAVSMGLDEDDMVVRRRLAQKMDFLFKDLSDITEPSDSDLQEYLLKNRNTYEIPPRATFTHVYFNTDRRGEEGAAKAARSLVVRKKAFRRMQRLWETRFSCSTGTQTRPLRKYAENSAPSLPKRFGCWRPARGTGRSLPGMGCTRFMSMSATMPSSQLLVT
jgi:hypothetical protein